MRPTPRPARGPGPRARLLAVLSCGALLLIAADASLAARPARLAGSTGRPRPAASRDERPGPAARAGGRLAAGAGLAAVGALFTLRGNGLGAHFCTASVVHSAQGDLALTAAHCVTGSLAEIAFVPGYANGREPYGAWPVAAIFTDPGWQSSQDPDDDIAFLRLAEPGGRPVEDVTGAERIAFGRPQPALVRVVGYPDGADQPVSCANWTRAFSATQLEFDCPGYTDGTSGGPFLADVSAATGQGTVIGLIGGYEQGGDTPDVSYSPVLGTAVAALYQAAQASG